MTVREQIVQALAALVASDSFFPPADIDADEPGAWRASALGLAAGLQDAAIVHDCQAPTITRDGGDEDTFELNGEFMVAYAVQAASTNRKAQRARRDAAADRITALIKADPTLGIDPSTYAQVGPPDRRNDVASKAGGGPIATLLVPIMVDYIAPSAAG